MANDPPFATLNHFIADLGIPEESPNPRVGIKYCDVTGTANELRASRASRDSSAADQVYAGANSADQRTDRGGSELRRDRSSSGGYCGHLESQLLKARHQPATT